MKNKLFLVALATVTVLGPSLVTPHHQTVHATEQALAGTCTYSDKNPNVGVCFESTDGTSGEEKIIKYKASDDSSFFTRLWTKIKTWFSSLTGINWE
ncbi:TPA: SpoV family signaling peptide [Streptococcus pyogenes]|nr:hypothetical protein [Streptococcus pyogenes]HEP1422448.1 hypothetical protein [Streptococcus pyogenes]HEP6141570.1 hypothetical protein [Streptococcus pyogenes]HEQ9036803.1 hypothetical protein [Streptococcus pyogenes]HEQ9298067.1 hypothetical protein [Streptococcus pyogenes]